MAEPAEANDLTLAQQLQHLERFAVDNDDLTALEERIGRFNIFDALKSPNSDWKDQNP